MSPEARRKKSIAMTGNRFCVGRVLSEKTRRKIAKALTGKRQSPATIAKRVASWKATAAEFGGLTPAHREQLERIHKSGPAHPNWKGGYAKERQARYGEPEYKKFVKAVLSRDKYTCQYCAVHNGMGENILLQVHHIKPYADYPELAYDINNGLTLCIHCHRKAHKGMPRPVDSDYHGKPKTCQICGQEFRVKNGRKYCPICKALFCCPVCGSAKCHHKARYLLQQTKLFEF